MLCVCVVVMRLSKPDLLGRREGTGQTAAYGSVEEQFQVELRLLLIGLPMHHGTQASGARLRVDGLCSLALGYGAEGVGLRNGAHAAIEQHMALIDDNDVIEQRLHVVHLWVATISVRSSVMWRATTLRNRLFEGMSRPLVGSSMKM